MNRTTATQDDMSFATVFCPEYEALLDNCQRALQAWSERSENARSAHVTGEGIGRQLLLLQARFAKSYDTLQRHVHSCERCVGASQMNHLYPERGLNSLTAC